MSSSETSLLWALCKPFVWVIGFCFCLAFILGIVLIVMAFPMLGAFLAVGGAFATMGGDGDMPEKS